MEVKHAQGQQDHALCGMAFDAFESGDADDPVVFAEPKESITCKECRAALDWARKNFTRYRYTPA